MGCPHTMELGLRLVFSALVDADHLDTAAHFEGRSAPRVRDRVDMDRLVARFESERTKLLAGRRPSPIDAVRAQLYRAAVEAADGAPGLFRLPAPTGSGKTITAAHQRARRFADIAAAKAARSATPDEETER